MKRSLLVALAGLLLLAAPAMASTGEVTAVSVLPGAGRALVVIDVRGDVEVTDFTLNNPARLVIDVRGARLRASAPGYDGANRGGIVNVRYSQFASDVVRVVLELDALRDYELEFADEAIRLSFGSDIAFAAWSSTAAAVAPSVDFDIPEPAEPLRLPEPMPQSQQAIVTASYDSEPIAGVIAAFAELSGRTIVIGKDLPGNVTAEIKNQPWDVAFRAILQSQGLVADEEVGTGIIIVDSPENMATRAQAAPTMTKIYAVNYARADSLALVLQQLATVIQTDSAGASQEVQQGAIVANVQTNDIIITDTRQRHEDIYGPLLDRLDRPTPQVSIQAKLISIQRTKLQELGFRYDLRTTTQNFLDVVEGVDAVTVDLGGKAVAAVANADQQVQKPALEMLYSIASGSYAFTAFLQALETVQLTDEQAEPLIATSDNTTASMEVGDEVPIRVLDTGGVSAAGGAARIELVQTGVILKVTPHVTASRQVLLNVTIDNSSVASFLNQPLFRRQEMTSQLLINDGQTAVIGGLTRTKVDETREGIPFLQNLPIIGKLFGRTKLDETRSDLLVLITPRIIDPTVLDEGDQ